MYKPRFTKSSDIYAIIDLDGEMSYVSLNAFLLIQDNMKPRRVDLAFRENSLINDASYEVIKRFDDSFTKAEFCQALDNHLERNVSVDTLIELYKRLPNVLSVNLLFL
jgi:hypothetical protein